MAVYKFKMVDKLVILFILISAVGLSCDRKQEVIIPTEGIETRDKGRLVFDNKLFNKNKDESYSSGSYRARYEYTDPVGTDIFLFFDSLEYLATYKHPDSLLGQFYKYYPNGQLKFKANEFLKGSFFVGKEYHYDLDGNVEKIINHDTIFNVPLAYVFEFMEEKGINFEKDVSAISKSEASYNERTGKLLEPNEWRIYTEKRIWRINADTGEEILKVLQWD